MVVSTAYKPTGTEKTVIETQNLGERASRKEEYEKTVKTLDDEQQ